MKKMPIPLQSAAQASFPGEEKYDCPEVSLNLHQNTNISIDFRFALSGKRRCFAKEMKRSPKLA